MNINITGFRTSNEFSQYIETLKSEKSFDTFTETIVHFWENQSDHEMEDIAKLLNKRIRDFLEVEAMRTGQIKESTVTLF